MAIALRHAPVIGPGRVVSSARVTRKVAIFGSHIPSLTDAPWTDASWELWGHSTARLFYQVPMDRYYDLHPRSCWTRGGKKGALYPKWLATQTTPIYMQHKFPDVPASLEYPKRRVLQEFGHPRPYFTNHVAWMIAHALMEGVTTIGLFGINYSIQSEYVMQRASAEYWLGRAAERGVSIVLPEQCSLLRDPAPLYGYESHDEETGILKDCYKVKVWPKEDRITPGQPGRLAVPTPDIAAEIAQEEIDFPRPEWALGPTDGAAKA
jgi:hypothetical protein